MTAHKHAALMLQYAQDAMETDRPWERWMWREANNSKDLCFRQCEQHPSWNDIYEYRRKPQVIRVGRHEFPKPITEAPEEGTVYWTIEVDGWNGFYVEHYKWLQNGEDESCIRQGLIHLSESAAQAHAATINAICRGDID